MQTYAWTGYKKCLLYHGIPRKIWKLSTLTRHQKLSPLLGHGECLLYYAPPEDPVTVFYTFVKFLVNTFCKSFKNGNDIFCSGCVLDTSGTGDRGITKTSFFGDIYLYKKKHYLLTLLRRDSIFSTYEDDDRSRQNFLYTIPCEYFFPFETNAGSAEHKVQFSVNL